MAVTKVTVYSLKKSYIKLYPPIISCQAAKGSIGDHSLDNDNTFPNMLCTEMKLHNSTNHKIIRFEVVFSIMNSTSKSIIIMFVFLPIWGQQLINYPIPGEAGYGKSI